MGVRVECDWCRKTIEAGEPYITVEIDGKVGGEKVGGPARVYCGDRRRCDDDPAAHGYWYEPGKWSWGPSCAERVLAALDGNPRGRVDMGLEWRLVAQGAPKLERLTNGPVELLKLDDQVLEALKVAGINAIWELAQLTEAQWLAIPGIGKPRSAQIRKALRRHENAKGAKLAAEEERLVSA